MTRTGGLVEVVQGKVAQGTNGTEQVEKASILSFPEASPGSNYQAPKLN